MWVKPSLFVKRKHLPTPGITKCCQPRGSLGKYSVELGHDEPNRGCGKAAVSYVPFFLAGEGNTCNAWGPGQIWSLA